jgi:hypothetical protein
VDSDSPQEEPKCINLTDEEHNFLMKYKASYLKAHEKLKPGESRAAKGKIIDIATEEWIQWCGHLCFTGKKYTSSDVQPELKIDEDFVESELTRDEIDAIKMNCTDCRKETRTVRQNFLLTIP